MLLVHEFPLGTEYTTVVENINMSLTNAPVEAILVDQTGVGESVLDFMRDELPVYIEGAILTVKMKQEIMANLQLLFQQRKVILPMTARRLFYQIIEQRVEISRSGNLIFSHIPNSHDDQLWALALAVYIASKGAGRAGILLP